MVKSTQALTMPVWQRAWVVWSSWLGVADGAPVGEEDEPSQVVGGLTPVELTPDATAEGLVGEPAEAVEGAQQLAVLQHGFGQRVLAGTGLEPGDEQGSRHVAPREGRRATPRAGHSHKSADSASRRRF